MQICDKQMWYCFTGEIGNKQQGLVSYKTFGSLNIGWKQLMDRCMISPVDSRHLCMYKVVHLAETAQDNEVSWNKMVRSSTIRKEKALNGRLHIELDRKADKESKTYQLRSGLIRIAVKVDVDANGIKIKTQI